MDRFKWTHDPDGVWVNLKAVTPQWPKGRTVGSYRRMVRTDEFGWRTIFYTAELPDESLPDTMTEDEVQANMRMKYLLLKE